MHFAGNDFWKAGPRVLLQLAWGWEEVAERKLRQVKESCRRLTFVLWGDWSNWKAGFKGNGQKLPSEEDGRRYNGYCEKFIEIACRVCDDVTWVRGEILNLPKTDAWHFDVEAKEGLQEILKNVGVHIGGGEGRPAREKVQWAPTMQQRWFGTEGAQGGAEVLAQARQRPQGGVDSWGRYEWETTQSASAGGGQSAAATTEERGTASSSSAGPARPRRVLGRVLQWEEPHGWISCAEIGADKMYCHRSALDSEIGEVWAGMTIKFTPGEQYTDASSAGPGPPPPPPPREGERPTGMAEEDEGQAESESDEAEEGEGAESEEEADWVPITFEKQIPPCTLKWEEEWQPPDMKPRWESREAFLTDLVPDAEERNVAGALYDCLEVGEHLRLGSDGPYKHGTYVRVAPRARRGDLRPGACTTGGVPKGGLFSARKSGVAEIYPMLMQWEEGEVPFPGGFPIRVVLVLTCEKF